MTRGSTVPLPLRIVAFCLVVTMALPPVAFANPQGAAVRHGQVQIQGGAGQLQIRQMSQRAVIDWESFSIDQGELTRFIQPGASSAVLNRVRGSAASQIEGMLRANGRVYLINPNGILIGPNGSVDVAGFVASTLDPGDRDFLGGGSMRFSGASDAAVVNLGSISALDGDVVLMGASVLNAGEIRAPRGTAALAAGNDILLAESGEERVFVRGAGGSNKAEGVTNTGNIEANIAELKAHGGNVYGIAVKNEGRVAATGVTRSGGQIFLSAGGGRVRSTGSLKARKPDGSGGRIKIDSGTTGKTEIGGTIDASGDSGSGGEIAILGNEIEVFDGTLILNDGESSGGATHIGGGAYGQDPRFSNAETLTVGNGAMISANALGNGNGGEIILFANDTATINGTVSARGGAYGGNGGFIEFSGRNRLYVPDLVGQVRLSAPLGDSGSLLLDPANITVTHGTGGGILGTTMTDGALMDVLANFPVLIWTSDYGSIGDGDITFAANVNLTWNTPHSLTFQADRDMIFLGGAQIFATGSGAFNATAARSISVGSGASIRTTNGNLTLSANQQIVATSGNFSGISISGGTVESTGTGVLSAIGRGGDTGNENAGINVVNGGKIIGGTSAITLLSGTGGPSGGTNNIGIQVTGANSLLSTNGSNLSVFGYGGGTGAASGGNSGVFVSSGGVITSGAFSGVSIEGTGGTGGGLNNKGVWISQSSPSSFGTITSGGGFVSITGVGGGSGASSGNQGVDVVGSNVILSTGGGALTVTGTAGLNTLTQAIRFGGAVSTAGNQPITIIGDSMSLLAGTVNSGTGITSIRPLTTNLAIDLGGFDVGGTTLGLSNTELDAITAGTVQIGNINTGPITVSSGILHGNHLSLTTGAGVTVNNAVTMAADKNFTSSAVGTINLATSASNLLASGTGAISLTTARNIVLADNSSITTAVGDITLSANATGTTSGLFEGIHLGNGASITSGTGQISLTGKGGDASGAGNHGIRLDTSSLILSLGGDIALDGTAIGASGSASSQEGIVLQGDIQTEGSGSITITGRGGNAVGGNVGVNIFNTSQVVTENGTIGITGTSGGGADSPGVRLADFGDSSVAILSNAGNITITGESPGELNPGILAFGYGVSVGGGTGNVTLESTGTTRFFNGAKIDTLGSGAVSITASRAIFLGADTSVTTENGNLSLSANQQVVPTPGNFAGIHVSGASVGSLGTGLVSLTGRGGDSGGNNYGVHLNGGAQVLGGTSNELVITGYGGAGEWAINAGVVVSDFGTLVSSLGGNVILSGTGGSATTTDSSSGVLITGSSTVTSGTAASVTIVGQGGAGANSNNRGVYIVSPFVNNPTTVSTGGGNLQITGTGGGTSTSLGDHGVEIAYGNSFPNVGSNGGTVTITGYTGPNPLNDGVRVDGNVTTTGNQNIQIYSNRLNITGGASINSGTGTTHILPISSGFRIDVGGADSATALGVADGELDRITAGTVLVGSTTTGLVSVSSAITSPNHLMLLSGAGVSVQAPMTMAPDRNLQINAIGTSNGTISLVGANAALSGSGTGLISLSSLRDIVLEPGSSISTLNGNISLTANQGPVPTPGNFSGIDLDGASISSTGTGTVSLSGRGGDGEGGQHGIRLRGGASVTTNARNLTLSGAAPDPLSSGLRIELAGLGAGGGTIQLTGSGGTTSISSTNASATIGSATDTVLIRSNSGDVSILGRVRGADLQVQDHSGTESVDFALTNTSNDINRINSFSNGSNGRIASLDFRDTDGFLVTEFLGASGVLASGNITLRSNLFSGSSVVIDRPVRSAGGNVLLRGLDVVIDGTQVTATGSGSLTLEAGQAILVWDDSLLSVTNGAMSLEANRDEGSLAGNFTGITVLGSRLQSLGTGGITLSGRGGNGGPGSNFSFPGFTNPSSNGIRLEGGTVISSSDSSSNDLGIELYGDGGGGISNSIGISISGIDTILTSAGRSVLLEGWGGGDSSGQRNRGVLFTGGLIEAANTGNVTLFGNGGSGVNENDGIQLDNGARVQVAGGELTLDGYGGETLGIGVMLGNTAGNLTVTGNGSATVKGAGTNAHGVFLGNSSALLGGANAEYVDVFSRGGNLTLRREITASGNVFVEADFGDVFIESEVDSRTGDIRIEGDNVTIDAPVTATDGDITVTFGDNGFMFEGEPEVLEDSPVPPFDGTGTINDLLSAGGRVRYVGGDGTGDVLTFAGYTISEIDLDIADLTDIENVVGTGSSDDRLQGPAAASNYQFTGPNQFNVGGVAFSAFENVLGGGGDDVFAFTGSASIEGALDGGSGMNRLDYSGYGTGIVVDLPLGAATGIVGGFENITNFTGSGNIDTVTGPGSASIYTFTGIDAMQVGTVSVAGFENLIAGPLEDRFVFLPGSSLRGLLDGGFSPTPVNNLLDYAGFGAPVTVNLATSTAGNLPGGFTGINRFQGSGSTRDFFSGPNSPTNYLFAGPNTFGTPGFQATGFENLSGGVDSDTFVFAPNTSLSGNLSGGDGPGSDTLTYAIFGRPVTVNIGPNTAPAIGGRFEGIERIVGSPGNDRFNFLNQSTIDFVDGGTGTDLIEINDSNLRGDNTYDINANSVSRNPLYTFNNFEALRLFLGTGNNTVNSGFFPFTQFLHGGNGFNTLNLPGVTTLNGPSPIGNVHHFGFDAPRPGGTDTGGLLQLEVNQNNGSPDVNTGQNSLTENRFSIIDPGTLNSQIGALGGAFSASVVAQAVIATVDGNSYLVLRPFSLDGSGLSPSNLGLAALNESLGVDANLELAAAIGFDGPVFLFNPDGPYSIDLSGMPADPAILTLLQESLSIAAAAELSAAIGLTLTVSITGADGIVPMGLDGSVPGQNLVLIFGDQLGAPAEAELNAAIAGGN